MSDALMRKPDTFALDLSQSYFELLGLSEDHDISVSQLEKAYLTLQRSAHPDRFANDSKGQILAVRYAAFINEAYETISSPLFRAQYLLQLKGVETDFGVATIADRMFLMEQMELREALSDIRSAPDPEAALEALIETVEEKIEVMTTQFVVLWQQGDAESLKQATLTVQKMHFLYKFMDEAEAEEARLLDL